VAVHTYEALFLLDAGRASSDWEGVSGQVNGVITRNGGEILHTRPWEVQKLAYPINRSRKGVYLLTYFKIESAQLAAIEADIRISEFVLRKLIIKLPPNVATEMLTHYTEEQHAPEEAAVPAT
jgi:small subunit ribosomal protein S6